jgi:hypothetical protein
LGYQSSLNPDYAMNNLLVNFIGVLGFLSDFIIANILKKLGMLSITPEIEIMGLDVSAITTDIHDEHVIINAEWEFVNKL